jgi:hypothetical protein
VTSDGMTHTKFHDDRFRNLSNIKDITSTVWEAIVFLKYSVEMASGDMIYIPILVTFGSGIWIILWVLPQQFERQ